MARYKMVDRSPRFLPIVLESQLIPGSFEHALDVLIDTEIDLSRLAKRFRNDATGAPAYDPAVMLKIVLLAYSRGVVSSRTIERLCRENVLFMAISGDSAPQFTTIAKFVRELGEEAGAIFTEVLLTCERLGLIGRQMFAIDGVKLPSNADKRRSGTHAELAHEAARMERAVAKMLQAHRSGDQAGEPAQDACAERERIERLQCEARRIREFLATHAERRSEKGAIRKSNVTDNDSAKWDKTASATTSTARFKPSDFHYDLATNTCLCPAGKKLYSTGSHCTTNARVHHKFQGAKRDCVPCDLRNQCLRHPERTPTRQVALFVKNQRSPLEFTERMKVAIDSELGRRLYGRRIATVEPVFANLRHNKRLDRFTLRTRPKVNAQWNLYCLVHNIEKLAHHGYAR